MQPLTIVTLMLGLAALYGIRELIRAKKMDKKIKADHSEYKKMLSLCDFNVDKEEKIGNRIIALDIRKQKLLFIDHNKRPRQKACFSLAEIVTSNILEVKNKKGGINGILLQMTPGDNSPGYSFCFFDEDHDAISDLPQAARRAKIWRNRINSYQSGDVLTEQEFVL